MWLITIYDAFTFISRQIWVSREINKWGVQRFFEAMQMVPSTHATLQVTSALLRKFEEKIWSGPEKSNNVAKTTKIEGYDTGFRLSPDPSYGCHGMPPRDMGGYWKGVMWLGTNMWMPLRSFWGKFGFHEEWINWVFRGFSRTCKWCQLPTQR